MTKIEMSYMELLSNILKRFLLLLGKLCGYKGFSVFLATMLLFYGVIGETVWVSVIISALCGYVVPKTAGIRGLTESEIIEGEKKNEQKEPVIFNKNKYAFNNDTKSSSSSCRRVIARGKNRIRSSVNNAFGKTGN